MNLFNLLLIIILFCKTSYSQNSKWQVFTNSDGIYSIAEKGKYLWLGTNGGLVKFNKETNESFVYNSANSVLKHNSIYVIEFDKKGVLWIYSGGELVRYDGNEWFVFNDSNSEISKIPIESITVDNSNTKWIVGWLGGFATYNDTTWAYYDTSNSGIKGGHLLSVAVDSNNAKWFGEKGYGITKLENGEWETIDWRTDGFRGPEVWEIFVDKSGNVWAGTEHYGVNKFDGNKWENFNLIGPDMIFNNSVFSIGQDSLSNIWFGGSDLLVKYDGITWQKYDDNNSILAPYTLTEIHVEKNGTVWIGNSGLVKFENEIWERFNLSNSGLKSSNIWSLLVDNDGNKWVSDEAEGILRYNNNEWRRFFSEDLGIEDSRFNEKFIAKDGNNNIWLAISGKGLVKYSDGKWEIIDVSNLQSLSFSSITIDKQNNLWISNWDNVYNGFNKYDPTTNSWEIYTSENNEIINSTITCLEFDNNNNLVIGTWRSGLILFDFENWSVLDTLNSGLPDNNITSISIDHNNNFWIGTRKKGIALFDGENWEIMNKENSVLPSNDIEKIRIIDNTIWIGTRGSLVKFEGEESTIYNSSNSGIPKRGTVNSIEVDDNNLWVATSSGLVLFENFKNPTSIQNFPELPKQFNLLQNFPNPFNPITTISFTIKKGVDAEQLEGRNDQKIQIKIYDILGRLLTTLVDENKSAGTHKVEFNGNDLPSGIYYYRLTAGNYSETKKMILLK